MIGSPEQLELIDALRGEIAALRATNAALSQELAAERRVTDELRKRDELSRELMENISTFVSLQAGDGSVQLINRRILEYTGKSVAELERWGMTDLVHPDDLPRAIDEHPRGIASGKPFDIVYRMRRHDGVYRWFDAHHRPMVDRESRVVRWCVSVTDIDDRKRAEDSLRESERKTRLIVDSIPGYIAVFSASGELELINRPLQEFLGRTSDEQKDWAAGDTIHPDDLEKAVAAFQTGILAGRSAEVELRTRRFDGVYRWLQSRTLPLRDANGTVSNWYNLLVDVDDRKRAEQALAASELNLKLAIDTIPALVWSARPDGSADFFNRRYQEFVGRTQEELQGTGWTALLHPDDLPNLITTWTRMMETGQGGEAEARLRRHDGVYRWLLFRANPLRDADGSIMKWHGVNTDIEDRKQAEAELRRSHDSFAAAQRLSKTGNFTADVVADTHVWSEELYRIFEFEPGCNVSVQDVRAVLHPDDLPGFDHGFQRSATEGTDFIQTFRIITSAANLKHLHVAARVFEFVEKRPVFIGAIRDVTESKLAEEALNRTRSELAHVARVTALSTLTASIAHEINQPLAGILTNAAACLRMLAAEPPNVEGARETARRTIRDGNRASDVIGGLRALFTRTTSTAEVVDLNEATRRVIELAWSELQKSRVELTIDLSDQLPAVLGDRVQLQQVILNLLLNAADAVKNVEGRARRIVLRTLKDETSNVKLSVTDTGIGIDPARRERLFDAFYTTKRAGMGIGLSVSRSIIEHHQGRIWAEPNDGAGAVFSFTLPSTRTE